MAKKQRTQEVLQSIRRNTCYNAGRTILLVCCVIMALLSLVGGATIFTSMDKDQPMVVLLSVSVVLGGSVTALLTHYVGNAFLDGADSLLQIAKFSERGQRSRVEALELARKHAVQEGSEEDSAEESVKEVSEEVSEEEALALVKEVMSQRVKEKQSQPDPDPKSEEETTASD